jgi:molecular chaperone GrpE
MAKKTKQVEELENALAELTLDLQRTRADFENYRKRTEQEKVQTKSAGEYHAVLKLLPVVDNIERALAHLPKELKNNKWAQSVAGLNKHLDTALESLNIKRIKATPGTEFNPELHEAIQFNEEATGSKEVIAEELRAGYTIAGRPFRHAMVKVTKK